MTGGWGQGGAIKPEDAAGCCKIEPPITADISEDGLSTALLPPPSPMECERETEGFNASSIEGGGGVCMLTGVKKEPVSPDLSSILTPPLSSTPVKPDASPDVPAAVLVNAELKHDLFGDDSDDELCVSDTDSNDSESSLDDLADLLTVKPGPEEEKQEKPAEVASNTNDMPILVVVPTANESSACETPPIQSPTTLECLSPVKQPVPLSAAAASGSPELTKLSVTHELHVTTDSSSSRGGGGGGSDGVLCGRPELQCASNDVCEAEGMLGPTGAVPLVHIEDGDPATSGDEMELSDLKFERLFSFGCKFLSPLPPSPVHPATVHLPSSPLPPSPCHTLQPSHCLPLAPSSLEPARFDHQGESESPISPLPPTPINAQLDIEQRTQIEAQRESTPINAHQEIEERSPINALQVIEERSPINTRQEKPLSPDPSPSVSAPSRPIIFADDTPPGLQSPIPCCVEVQSQSPGVTKKFDFEPSKKKLRVSKKSLFSPPLPRKSTPGSSLLVSHMRRLSEGPGGSSSTAAPSAKRRHVSANACLMPTPCQSLGERRVSTDNILVKEEEENESLGGSLVVLEASDSSERLKDSLPSESDDVELSSEDLLDLAPSTAHTVTPACNKPLEIKQQNVLSMFTATSLVDCCPGIHSAVKPTENMAVTVSDPAPSTTTSCCEEGEITEDEADAKMMTSEVCVDDVFSQHAPQTAPTSFDMLLRSCRSQPDKANPTSRQQDTASIGYVPTGRFPAKETAILPPPHRSGIRGNSKASSTPKKKNKKNGQNYGKDSSGSVEQLPRCQATSLQAPPQKTSSLQHILDSATPPVKRPRLDHSDSESHPDLTIEEEEEEEDGVQATPPPSPSPQATSEAALPGYRLRSRKVEFFESVPKILSHSIADRPHTNSLNASLKPAAGDSRSGSGEGVRVVRTDGATGQEEDQTPASSPKRDVVSGTTTTTAPTPLPPPSSLPQSGYTTTEPIKQDFKKCVQRDFKKSAPVRKNDGPISDLLQIPLNSAAAAAAAHQTPPLKHHPPPPPPPPPPPHPPHPALLPASAPPPSARPTVSLSPGQRQLSAAMHCPLPLPPWLVTSMGNVQLTFEHCSASVFKKKHKRVCPTKHINRPFKQSPVDYVRLNLSRLACGGLNLAPVIAMFSEPQGCPSANEFIKGAMLFLMESYFPKTDHVLNLSHKLCDSVASTAGRKELHLSPLDPAFPPPLLRPETQLVALFAHLCRMHPHMVRNELQCMS